MDYRDALDDTLDQIDCAGAARTRLRAAVLPLLQKHVTSKKQWRESIEKALGGEAVGWKALERRNVELNAAGLPALAFHEAIRSRVESSVNLAGRLQAMLAAVSARPCWQFQALQQPRTPEECRRLSGTIAPWDGTIWKRCLPPCWRPDCGCTIRALRAAKGQG